MVPVNVRNGDDGDLGNHISFMFVDLPCEEEAPVRRLERVHEETSAQKAGHTPEAGDSVLRAVGHAPRPLQHAISRLIASPLAFNLTVSNIPGTGGAPHARVQARGGLSGRAALDRHAVSIGMTTVGDTACFGIYCDPVALPDGDALSLAMDESIDELIAA